MSEISKPLNLKRFMNECCSKRKDRNGEVVITFHVDGRLLRSHASPTGREEYFVVKLKEPALIQRYMIILRARGTGSFMTRTNILRYEKSAEACDVFLMEKKK